MAKQPLNLSRAEIPEERFGALWAPTKGADRLERRQPCLDDGSRHETSSSAQTVKAMLPSGSAPAALLRLVLCRRVPITLTPRRRSPVSPGFSGGGLEHMPNMLRPRFSRLTRTPCTAFSRTRPFHTPENPRWPRMGRPRARGTPSRPGRGCGGSASWPARIS